MELTLMICAIYIFCGFCKGQDIQNGKIVVSDSRTCATLEDQEHSSFKCHVSDSGEVCVLKCHQGYVPPITYTPAGELMEVSQRGTYRCKSVTGGFNWVPDILYDCVERVEPSHLILHFGLTIEDTCNSTDDLEILRQEFMTEARDASDMMKGCNGKVEKGCQVEVYLTRKNLSLEMDLEIMVPLTEKNSDDFPSVRDQLKKDLPKDAMNIFVCQNSTIDTKYTEPGFFTDCPDGTRLESDLTCRGCSKGYYLDRARAECAPCPRGTYQDRNLQASCLTCPEGAFREEHAIQNMADCFDSGTWRKHTSVSTVLSAVACIVAVVTIILAFRSRVTNEPGPNTVEEEVLGADMSWKVGDKTRGPSLASGDFSFPSYKAMKTATEQKKDRLLHKTLPLEPGKLNAADSEKKRRDRMRITMDANIIRQSASVKSPSFRQSRNMRKSMASALKLRQRAEEDEEQKNVANEEGSSVDRSQQD